MNFNAQVKIVDNVIKNPGRFYLHNFGIQVWGSNVIPSAKRDFLAVSDKIEEDYLWVLGILWGDSGIRVSEIFAYRGIQKSDWPGNPEIDYFQFRGRQLVVNPRSLTCGDGLIVLGREEGHRRHKHNLADFLNDPPRFASGEVRNYF